MRARALGTSSAPAWSPLDTSQQPAPPAGPETVAHAVVAARDRDGLVSELALPAQLATKEVALFVHGEAGAVWAARVHRDGKVTLGNDAGDALRACRPGVAIVAALDPAGRVLALTAQSQRRAAASRIATRSRSTEDRYAHNPHELLITGNVGRVIRVS